jgi:hypothetical protein
MHVALLPLVGRADDPLAEGLVILHTALDQSGHPEGHDDLLVPLGEGRAWVRVRVKLRVTARVRARARRRRGGGEAAARAVRARAVIMLGRWVRVRASVMVRVRAGARARARVRVRVGVPAAVLAQVLHAERQVRQPLLGVGHLLLLRLDAVEHGQPGHHNRGCLERVAFGEASANSCIPRVDPFMDGALELVDLAVLEAGRVAKSQQVPGNLVAEAVFGAKCDERICTKITLLENFWARIGRDQAGRTAVRVMVVMMR